MRIDELHLRAVGPFTDLKLDLSGGSQGLHLIYGPNEAGKSSTLRAIRYRLYGFPASLDDDFLHSYANLRVGGQLRNDRGETLRITRRKAKLKTLRDGDDDKEVREEQLQRFLGGAGEDLFRRAFGIDHETLVRGGQEIVQGQGDLAQALFSGTGTASLRRIEQQLEKDLAGLFAPKAQNPRINAQLRSLNQTRDQVRDLQLRPAEWQQHYDALNSAIHRKQQTQRERDDLRIRRDRLFRLKSAVSPVSEHLAMQSELNGLRDVRALPPDFNKRREDVLRQLSAADSKKNSADEEIRRRQNQLDKIEVPRRLLDAARRCELLSDNLKRFQDSQADRPAVAAELKSLETEARNVLRELGNEVQLGEATSLLLPATERKRIQQLVANYGKLAAAVEESENAVTRFDAELAERRRELDQCAAAPDSQGLARALNAALRLDDIEDRIVQLNSTIGTETDEANLELTRLPGWSGSLEELERMKTPVPETIDRFADHLREIDNAIRTIDLQLRQTEDEAAAREREIADLQSGGEVPSEQQLCEIRIRRDAMWDKLNALWRESNADSRVCELLAQINSGPEPLDQTYEELVNSADVVSDRLRKEADRVARHAQLQTDLARSRAKISQLRQQRDDLTQRSRLADAQWHELWSKLHVVPQTPREMVSWLQRHSALLERARRLRSLQQDRADLVKKCDEGKQQLAGELSAAGQPPAPDTASLDDMRERTQEAVQQMQMLRARRQELETTITQLERQLGHERHEQARAQDELQRWQEQWQSAAAKLPQTPRDKPGEAGEILELLNQLSQRLSSAQLQRARLDQIDAFSGTFERQVRELASEFAPDLSIDLAANRLAGEILSRFNAAVELEQKRKQIEEELKERTALLESATMAMDDLRSQLNQLCKDAGCESPNDLLDAWERAERKRHVQHRLDEIEKLLRELSAGAPPMEFMAETRAQNPDTLPIEIERLDADIQQRDGSLVDISQKIGSLQATLDAMDSSGEAAKAEESARDVLAGLADSAQEYALLAVAQAALREGIERYRKRHQSGLLATASEIFAQLTAGSFQGLKADFDSSGEPAIMGVRNSTGDTVPVSGLSEGTADQLYFALRYAWLTNYLDSHESLPFIVDDILIRFDDQRASKTLDVLAALSKRTQVLFFTHHRHLVDAASRQLPGDLLFHHHFA
jgi:uncharacterized protein YhaN